MIEPEPIRKALSSFLDSFTAPLARVLAFAAETGQVSYDEVEKLVEDEVEEIMLSGNNWRLLVPARTSKSIEWEDRVLLLESGEIYEMPHVVQYLVREASRTGQWEPAKAVAEVFKAMGEPEWARMPQLVELLGRQAKANRISALQVKEACQELGLGERVDPLIAELKGSGIMSPSLGSLTEAVQRRAPIYELNPSLFVK